MALAADLKKFLGRAEAVPPTRLAGAALGLGARRVRHRLDELSLSLRTPLSGDTLLRHAVDGAADAAEAVRALDGEPGRGFIADVPAWAAALRERHPNDVAALVEVADRALAGEYFLFGRWRALGAKPDWSQDFLSQHRWRALPAWRLDASVGRGVDVKLPWELARLQHLVAVGTAYAVTGDERFPAYFAEHVTHFLDQNPHPLGPAWMASMEVGLRAASLAWAHQLMRRSKALSPAFKARLYAGVVEHARHLVKNPDDVGFVVGNHHVCGLAGLAFLGCLYPAFREAKAWRARARRGLGAELARQLHPDGGGFEASVPYHRLVLEAFAASAHLFALNGLALEPAWRGALRRGFAFAAACTLPDGTLAQLGDNDSGRFFRLLPRASLDARHLDALGAHVLGEPPLSRADDAEAALAFGLPRHPPLLDRDRYEAQAPGMEGDGFAGDRRGRGPPLPGVEGDGFAGDRRGRGPPLPGVEGDGFAGDRRGRGPPLSEVRTFPESGVHVLGAGGVRAWVSAGSTGQRGAGGHSHNDKLAFELWLGGGALVGDPGTACYTGDVARRNAYRSTRAHATLMLDGREQNPLTADAFWLPDVSHARVTSVGTDGKVARLVAHHVGYLALSTPVTHVRAFTLDADGLDVDDRLDGEGRHEVLATIPLPPGAQARIAASSVLDGVRRVAWEVDRPGFAPALIAVRAPAGLEPSIDPVSYSPGYREEVPALALRLRGKVTCPSRLSWRFTVRE